MLDVGPILGITDHFLICSGQTERQTKTIADEIEVRLKSEGLPPLRSEGDASGGWVLIDYGDFIVHVFTDAMREYYDLERLWKDVPRPELPELDQAREAL